MAAKGILALAAATAAVAGASAQADCSTWYESTKHGPAFRNVMDFGAKGDGVSDDTAALTTALTQNRTSAFTLKTPAVVYLPPGTYLVSGSLPLWFNSYLVGNFRCRPTIVLKAGTWPAGTGGGYVISADTSDAGDHDNEFYRSIMHVNIVIGDNNGAAGGIHWSVSQATQIRNVSIDVGSGNYGIFMENGSGGFISDLVVNGGEVGLAVGNQQWHWRDVTVSGSRTACIKIFWNWIWAFLGLNVSDCPVGIDFTGGAVGGLLLLDSAMTNISGIGVQTDWPSRTAELLFERLTVSGVDMIAPGLPGTNASVSTVFIPAWRQGAAFSTGGVLAAGSQGFLPLTREDAPLPRRARPTFGGANGTTSLFNVYDFGAVGDGVADDTKALLDAIEAYPAVFLPAGAYRVTQPLRLRPDSVLVGEGLSAIIADAGAAAWQFPDAPTALLTAPLGAQPQLADIIFTSNGPVPGCVFLDWQAGSEPGGAWDTHWRLYAGGHTLLRVGAESSGPQAGLYIENSWGWVADHDIDTGAQLNVSNPFGFLLQGSGPQGSYLYGTAAEHSYASQYNISGAAGLTAVIMQTETPYWQNPQSAWALTASGASDLHIYGTGFYSWFYPNQSAIAEVRGCSGSAGVDGYHAFGFNTHASLEVLVTDDGSINATSAAVENWFCSGFAAYTGIQ